MKSLEEIREELETNNNMWFSAYSVKDKNDKFTSVVDIDTAMRVISELITPIVVKRRVCEDCHYHPSANDCRCHYGTHKTVLLEFHKCPCCGMVGYYPIDSDFNEKEINEGI